MLRSCLRFAGLPPAFWAALCTLVINDHLLKGSGLLPSGITGKLSDFAGLIVAPVLLCAAFSVRTDRARGLCIGLVAAGFAAIKLSPMLAHEAGQALTAIGIPSRIWSDPTDLIAFAVLPLAAMLAKEVQPMPARLSRRFAISVAALACLATSEDGPYETELHAPFVINWTRGAIEVQITRRVRACDAVMDAVNAVQIRQRFTLGPAQMAQLGQPRDFSNADASFAECQHVEIAVGDAKQRTAWRSSFSEPMKRDVEGAYVENQDYIDVWHIAYDDDWAFERAVTIYGSASSPRFEIGELLEENAP